jgi:hypothetical protein
MDTSPMEFDSSLMSKIKIKIKISRKKEPSSNADEWADKVFALIYKN